MMVNHDRTTSKATQHDGSEAGSSGSPGGGGGQEAAAEEERAVRSARRKSAKRPDSQAQEAGDAAEQAGTPDRAQAERPAAERSAEELERALEDAERRAKEHRDSLLRARAEFENLRKRSERELENAHKYSLERFVSELLPVHDSLELGLAAAGESADVAKLREGMELTLRMFDSVLEKFGVEQVNPADARFDPQVHEAMSTQEVEGVQPGTVTSVVQKGFTLNGRLVRPALVIVAR